MSAPLIYPTVLDNTVFPAISQDIGILTREGVKVVNKMHTSTQVERPASIAHWTALYGTETNAFHVRPHRTSIQQPEDANYAHQDSLIIKDKGDAHALSKLHISTKTPPASIVNLHIFGIS